MQKHFTNLLKSIAFFVLLACLLSCLGCDQEPTPLPCETENFGTLVLENTQPQAYGVWLDNIYQGEWGPGEKKPTQSANVDAKTYSLQAENEEFVITKLFTVATCRTNNIQF